MYYDQIECGIYDEATSYKLDYKEDDCLEDFTKRAEIALKLSNNSQVFIDNFHLNSFFDKIRIVDLLKMFHKKKFVFAKKSNDLPFNKGISAWTSGLRNSTEMFESVLKKAIKGNDLCENTKFELEELYVLIENLTSYLGELTIKEEPECEGTNVLI